MTYLVLLRGSWQNNDVGPLPVGALAVVVGQPVVPVLGLGLDLLESALAEHVSEQVAEHVVHQDSVAMVRRT